MIPKYDDKTREKVLETYDTLREYQDRANKNYSLTAIKEGISEGTGLRLSDVDKILYGKRIKTDNRLTDIQKDWITSIYNNYKNISISQMAKDFSKSSGKKISTDYIYKILHEKSNEGYEVKWRGRPSSLKKNKGIEKTVEESYVEPVSEPIKVKVKNKTKRDYSLSWFNKAAGIAVGIGLTIGSVLGIPISKTFNNYIQPRVDAYVQEREAELENLKPAVLASANVNFDNQFKPGYVSANLEDNLDNNFSNKFNHRIGLTDALWVPKAEDGKVVFIRSGEISQEDPKSFGSRIVENKDGCITLIKGQDIEYWEIPEAFK